MPWTGPIIIMPSSEWHANPLGRRPSAEPGKPGFACETRRRGPAGLSRDRATALLGRRSLGRGRAFQRAAGRVRVNKSLPRVSRAPLGNKRPAREQCPFASFRAPRVSERGWQHETAPQAGPRARGSYVRTAGPSRRSYSWTNWPQETPRRCSLARGLSQESPRLNAVWTNLRSTVRSTR